MTRVEEAPGADRIKRLLGRAQSLAAVPLVAAAVLLLAAVVLLGHGIERHIAALESWVTRLGPWGIVAFAGLLALGTSLLLPEALFSIAAGASFGPWWGLLGAVAGNLLAASVQYALSRRLLRRPIQRALATRPSLAAIQGTVARDELRLQVLLRLTPLNPATMSYLLGAAGVRFSGFMVACLAQTPHLFLEVYFGHAGKHVARMAGSARAAELRDVATIGGLLVGIVVMVVASKIARKAVMQAVAETEANEPRTGAA